MEFTVTEELVREAHGAACSTWKQRIEKEFPELFKTELEVGKWYKSKYGELEWLMNYQGRGFVSCGFSPTKEWINGYVLHNHDSWTPATTEEVESALIAEAKKRGYVGKEIVLMEGVLSGTHSEIKMQDEFSFEAGQNQLMCECFGCESFTIFKDGKWAEILHQGKTVITKGKALRIIAKKLKVSPESIEIQ